MSLISVPLHDHSLWWRLFWLMSLPGEAWQTVFHSCCFSQIFDPSANVEWECSVLRSPPVIMLHLLFSDHFANADVLISTQCINCSLVVHQWCFNSQDAEIQIWQFSMLASVSTPINDVLHILIYRVLLY